MNRFLASLFHKIFITSVTAYLSAIAFYLAFTYIHAW